MCRYKDYQILLELYFYEYCASYLNNFYNVIYNQLYEYDYNIKNSLTYKLMSLFTRTVIFKICMYIITRNNN